MTARVLVIGAGMGGLSAALRLAREGFDVHVLEARPESGGLASAVHYENFVFDAGPYILLDRPGLEWAFQQLGLDLGKEIRLLPLDSVYSVESERGTRVEFYGDLEKTAAGLDSEWPGSGDRYRSFVRKMSEIGEALTPMLRTSHPGAMDLLWSGAARYAPFLLKSLETVLQDSGLPEPVVEGLAIWTHVAGQTMSEAPSPLAFVPVLIHTAGAFYPEEGISTIPKTMERAAKAAGVKFHYSVRVTCIRTENGRTVGVETDSSEFIDAAAVLSNAAAIGAYLKLLDATPAGARDLKSLPLQSPGVCAYLAVRGAEPAQYLRFRLNETNDRCRLLIQPAAVLTTLQRQDWMPVRLLGPMAYSAAEQGGPAAQSEYLDGLLEEDWWKEGFTDVRVLGRRIPKSWGSDFNLYADSMNPVMTARFMRQGRIAHRSPYVRRLYFAGSSTHPGQWVSFCAVSGVHAANCIIKDLS